MKPSEFTLDFTRRHRVKHQKSLSSTLSTASKENSPDFVKEKYVRSQSDPSDQASFHLSTPFPDFLHAKDSLVHFPLPNEVRPSEHINSSSVHASSMQPNMSVVKFHTACLLLVLTNRLSTTDAAFVKKYLEARLLAQMLSNPRFPDPSLLGAFRMLPKP